jgi:hypothetical protein
MTPGFMNAPTYVFHWHILSVDIYISAANLIVIGLMLLIFVLALVLPFPGGRKAS